MAQRAFLRPLAFASTASRSTYRTQRPFSTVLDTPIFPAQQEAPPTTNSSVFQDAVEATAVRTNWTTEEISQIYNTPLMELTYASVSALVFNYPSMCS
jgi:biotin synthase